MTVTEQLRQDNALDEVGGAAHIAELTSRVYSAAHVEYHAKIIAQKYLAGRLIAFSSQIETQAFDESNDVDDLLQEAEGKLFEISQTQLKREVTQIDPVISLALEQIQAASNNDSGLSGLPTGYTELDKYTSGWQSLRPHNNRRPPGNGKDGLRPFYGQERGRGLFHPVAIFTLEMANVQLVKRLISNVAELTGDPDQERTAVA